MGAVQNYAKKCLSAIYQILYIYLHQDYFFTRVSKLFVQK